MNKDNFLVWLTGYLEGVQNNLPEDPEDDDDEQKPVRGLCDKILAKLEKVDMAKDGVDHVKSDVPLARRVT